MEELYTKKVTISKSEAMKNEYLLKKDKRKRFEIKQKYQKKHKIIIMKVSILLPYKENFSPNYPGAVSLFVKDTSLISKYRNSI